MIFRSIHDSLRNIHVGMYHVCAKPWSIVLCFEHIFAVSVDRLTCSLDMFPWLRIGVLVGASEEFCLKNIRTSFWMLTEKNSKQKDVHSWSTPCSNLPVMIVQYHTSHKVLNLSGSFHIMRTEVGVKI